MPDIPDQPRTGQTDPPAEDPPQSDQKGTYVSVALPVSEFNHGVKGVPVITNEPQHVAAKFLPALREATLASYGVTLIEEKQS